MADVAWEAYKLKKRDYKTENGAPMTMPQLLVERSTFQVITIFLQISDSSHTR